MTKMFNGQLEKVLAGYAAHGERIKNRYLQQIAVGQDFFKEFADCKKNSILPVMETIGKELCNAGHNYNVLSHLEKDVAGSKTLFDGVTMEVHVEGLRSCGKGFLAVPSISYIPDPLCQMVFIYSSVFSRSGGVAPVLLEDVLVGSLSNTFVATQLIVAMRPMFRPIF